MKKILLATALLCSVISIHAQELLVEYDAITDEVHYYMNGKEINSPKVKQKQNIRVKVKNFNNYTLVAGVEALSKADLPPSASQKSVSMMGMIAGSSGLPGFPSGGNSGADKIGGDGPYGSGDSGEDDDEGFGWVVLDKEISKAESVESMKLVSQQITSQQFSKLQTQYQQISQQLISIEKKIEVANQNVTRHMNTLTVVDITDHQLSMLRQNRNLSGEEMKEFAKELISELVQVSKDEEVPLRKALDFANEFEMNVDKDMMDMETLQEDYQTSASQLALLSTEIAKFENSNELMPLKQEIKGTINKSKAMERRMVKKRKSTNTMMTRLEKENFPMNVTKLYMEYNDIMKNSFEHNFVTTARGDYMEIGIQLYTKADTSALRGPELYKDRKLHIPVYGGIKVNSSIGIGFAQFFTQQMTYYNRDSTILASESDRFIPTLTTMLHFYRQNTGSTALGGAFGVGFPLMGDNRNLTFFLGPSMILGKGERIILTGGVMGGQVKKLDRGYQVGDVFGSEGEIIPTSSSYELGYFLAVTFNLNSLGN